MAFDLDKLFVDCEAKIEKFARQHPDETFYAFAIDADLLCLNSIEQFTRTLSEYRSQWERRTRHIDSLADMSDQDWQDAKLALKIAEWNHGLDRSDEKAVLQLINENRLWLRSKGCDYHTEDGIKELRYSTGDWPYQGFARMDEQDGFARDLYNDHYEAASESDNGHAPHTEYAIAMSELVDRLRCSDAFDTLKRTDDFVVTWVDHTY